MTNELENLCQTYQQYQYALYVAENQSEEDSDVKDLQWSIASTLYLNVLGDGFELMEELSKEAKMYVANATHINQALERIVGKM